MKKLLLIAILSLSMSSYSQETFVNKYTVYMTKKDSVKSEVKPMKTVIVFNYEKTTDIVIYSSDKTIRLYRTGEIIDGKSTSGYIYQIVNCIDSEIGDKFEVQLFEKSVRIFINDSSDYIEYY